MIRKTNFDLKKVIYFYSIESLILQVNFFI